MDQLFSDRKFNLKVQCKLMEANLMLVKRWGKERRNTPAEIRYLKRLADVLRLKHQLFALLYQEHQMMDEGYQDPSLNRLIEIMLNTVKEAEADLCDLSCWKSFLE